MQHIHLEPRQVWGGNDATQRPVMMAGFEGFLSSQPYQGAPRGGDVYLLSTCGRQVLSRVFLADVSGHGSESVVKSAEGLRTILGQYVGQPNHEQLLYDLNAEIGDSDTAQMTTMVVAGMYSGGNELIYAGAGHPPILRKRKGQPWQPLEECVDDRRKGDIQDIPLGVLPGPSYQQHKVFLNQGDMLLFYTDAYTDLAGGRQGWIEAVDQLKSDTPEAIVQTLQSRFPASEHDDATLICLQVTSSGEKVTR